MPRESTPPAASLLLSLRGSVLWAGAAWADLTGHDTDRLQSGDVWAVVEPPDHAPLRAAIDEMAAGGLPALLAVGVHHTSGRSVPVLVELTLVTRGPGAPVLALSARTGTRVTPGVVHEAWRHGRLTLDAQPIRDASSLEVIRHELLVRMRLPGGRVVEAGAFLPAAERLGLALDIDCWVARRAVDLLGRPGNAAMAVEVNLSPVTVQRPRDLLRTLEGTLADVPGAAGRLMAALPGAAVAQHPEAALYLLAGLQGLGVAAALDHVGGTADELALIDLLPFDTIKISGQLASAAVEDRGGLARLVRTIEAAHARGAVAVAACLDDSAALAVVCSQGVDALQGYQVGAPRAAVG